MALIGSVDVLEVAVGLRGEGKSTTMASQARDLSALAPAYVIGHSLGARLPSELPDGTVLPIEYHATIERVADGVRHRPQNWHILARGSADPVLLYARKLSESIRERAWRDAGHLEKWGPERKMDGIEAPMVIVMIDEGIAAGAAAGKAQAKEENAWFVEMVFSLRHEHTALYFNIQNASARSWLLLDQASRIHVHRTRHLWAINALRSAGCPEDELARIPKLEVGETIVIE